MTRFTEPKDEEMLIQHTTYDECRGGRSASRRASATITFKVKNYLSERLSRYLDDNDHIPLLNTTINTERVGTGWSYFGTSSHPPPPKPEQATQMTSYLTQQHRIQKGIHKEDKIIKSANSNGSYLPLNDKANKLPIIPRVNGKFVKNRWSRNSIELEKRRSDHEKASIEKLQMLRTAIRDGKLEKVVPPPNGKLFSPTNPFRNPPSAESSHPTKEDSTSKPRGHSGNRNSKSMFTNKKVLATYISNTGDVLDATRREIKESFEHLNYPSFSLSRRASNSSDDSFYCIGEREAEQKANTKAVKELKACYQEPERVSAEGTSPWVFPDEKKCRLCRNRDEVGGTGMCRDCKREFERPKTRIFGLEFTNNKEGGYEEEEEEEIKPTPPLKDKKIIARKDQTRFHFEPEDMEMGEMKPPVPRKDEARKDVSSNPGLERKSERQSVQRAKIEEQGYRYEVYNHQPTKQKKVAVDEKTRNVFEKWGKAYGSGDFGNFDKREEYGSMIPLIEKNGRETKKSAVNRRSSFYGFWDDVLGELVSRR